jgi:transcriptional regulator
MNKTQRMELLQGTLDLLILRSLLFGEAHGHAIAKHIQRTSEDALQVETGTLYPALHKLEKLGLISSKWATSDKGKRAKYYRLTPAGKRCLAEARTRWEKMSQAIGRVLESLAWSGIL